MKKDLGLLQSADWSTESSLPCDVKAISSRSLWPFLKHSLSTFVINSWQETTGNAGCPPLFPLFPLLLQLLLTLKRDNRFYDVRPARPPGDCTVASGNAHLYWTYRVCHTELIWTLLLCWNRALETSTIKKKGIGCLYRVKRFMLFKLSLSWERMSWRDGKFEWLKEREAESETHLPSLVFGTFTCGVFLVCTLQRSSVHHTVWAAH